MQGDHPPYLKSLLSTVRDDRLYTRLRAAAFAFRHYHYRYSSIYLYIRDTHTRRLDLVSIAFGGFIQVKSVYVNYAAGPYGIKYIYGIVTAIFFTDSARDSLALFFRRKSPLLTSTKFESPFSLRG